MPEAASYFCDDVLEARDRFLDLCVRTGIPSRCFKAETKYGQTLSCDVARLGASSAPSLIVLATGAPGRGGFVNAGICTTLLGEHFQRNLSRNVSILMVHAINPDGPAWASTSKPSNPTRSNANGGLEQPSSWSDDLLRAADERFKAHIGNAAPSQDAPTQKNSVPSPAWSSEQAAKIIRGETEGAQFVLFLDFRTGLGTWAVSTFITPPVGHDPITTWIQRHFTSVETGLLQNPKAPAAAGLSTHLENVASFTMTIEFGTLHRTPAFGSMTSADAIPSHYPASTDWRNRVWGHAQDTLRSGIVACEELTGSGHVLEKKRPPIGAA